MRFNRSFFSATAIALIAVGLLTGCSREARKARHAKKGDGYYQKQEYSKAELEYLSALQNGPRDADLVRKIAFVYDAQGRVGPAIRALSMAKELRPNDVDVSFRLANVLFGLRDYAQARTNALFVARNQSTNTAALLLLADTAFQPEEIAETKKLIETTSKQIGTNAGICLAAAALFLKEGNTTGAEEELKRATALQSKSPAVDTGWARLRLAQTNFLEAEVLLKRAAEASPITSLPRLQWADFRLGLGDLKGAKEIFENITHEAPEFVPAWYRLAEIAFVEKRNADCEKLTSKILGLDDGNYQALLLRARMWGAQNKIDKAIEELGRLVTLYPKSPQVQYELALAQLQSGDTTKASAALNEALRLDPRHVQAILLQAELNIRSGNPGAAVTALTDLLKKRPELKEVAVALARALLVQGRTDDSLKLCREMTVRYPKDPEAWTMTGLLLRQKGDSVGARDMFEHSLNVSPTFVPAFEQLAELDLVTTNFPAALTRATQLTAVVTNSAAGFLLEAKVRVAMKDLKAAEAALLKAAEREPESSAVLAFLAAVYFENKDYDNALKKLDAMIAADARAFQAWMQKGIIYEVKAQPDKAIEAYQRAIEINPAFASPLNNLALLIAEDPKRLDEAFAKATRAHELAPTDPSIADTLGWISFKHRDFAAARRLLTESWDKLHMAEIAYHLAMVEYASGDEDKARQRFTQALQGNLRKELADDTTAHLAILNFNPASPTAAQLEQLEMVAKRDASDYLAHYRLAIAHYGKGDIEKAKTEFETASRANPKAAEPLLALARLYMGSDSKRALQLAKDARQLAPTDASVALTLGSLSLSAHEYSTALSLLQEGLRAGKSSPEALLDLGIAQFAAGRISEATATLQNLAEKEPAGAVQQTARGALVLMGQTSFPLNERKALAEAQLKSDPQSLLGLVAMAQIEEQQNAFAKAAELYETVVTSAPGFWPARKQLAYLYAERLGNEKSAYTHALKAREAAPADPQLARILGKIALNRGELANALRLFQETTQGNQINGESYYWVGLANFRLKRTNDCKLALNKALQMSLPADQEAEAKKLISQLQ